MFIGVVGRCDLFVKTPGRGDTFQDRAVSNWVRKQGFRLFVKYANYVLVNIHIHRVLNRNTAVLGLLGRSILTSSSSSRSSISMRWEIVIVSTICLSSMIQSTKSIVVSRRPWCCLLTCMRRPRKDGEKVSLDAGQASDYVFPLHGRPISRRMAFSRSLWRSHHRPAWRMHGSTSRIAKLST